MANYTKYWVFFIQIQTSFGPKAVMQLKLWMLWKHLVLEFCFRIRVGTLPTFRLHTRQRTFGVYLFYHTYLDWNYQTETPEKLLDLAVVRSGLIIWRSFRYSAYGLVTSCLVAAVWWRGLILQRVLDRLSSLIRNFRTRPRDDHLWRPGPAIDSHPTNVQNQNKTQS